MINNYLCLGHQAGRGGQGRQHREGAEVDRESEGLAPPGAGDDEDLGSGGGEQAQAAAGHHRERGHPAGDRHAEGKSVGQSTINIL